MFAIVQVGSFQYRISEGNMIETQLLEGKKGERIILDQVLLWADGSNVRVGQPFLNDVKIAAEILTPHQGPKLISYKYRRRKTSAWKKGHRQKLTCLRIDKIEASFPKV